MEKCLADRVVRRLVEDVIYSGGLYIRGALLFNPALLAEQDCLDSTRNQT